jgi:hypothetical protein
LRTVEDDRAIEPGDVVWVVTIDPLSERDLIGLDRGMADCLESPSGVDDIERFGDFQLERIECAR